MAIFFLPLSSWQEERKNFAQYFYPTNSTLRVIIYVEIFFYRLLKRKLEIRILKKKERGVSLI